jgi:hypothetical protein
MVLPACSIDKSIVHVKWYFQLQQYRSLSLAAAVEIFCLVGKFAPNTSSIEPLDEPKNVSNQIMERPNTY